LYPSPSSKQPPVLPLRDTPAIYANSSALFRLFVAYTVFLLAWQCPPNSQLNEASHSFCHPLHKLIHNADPYYKKYAAPYVDIARPYYDNQVKPYADVFHAKVAGPAIDKSIKAYSDYVQPVVAENYEKLQQYTHPYSETLKQYAQPYSDKIIDSFNSRFESAGSSAWSSANDYYDRIKESVIEPGYDKLKENVIDPGQEKINVYGQEAIEYSKRQLYPQARIYSSIAREWISTNLAHGWRWLVAIVSPKVNAIYRRAIEPQVNKIIDRIFENTERALTSETDMDASVTGLDDATSTATVESTDKYGDDFDHATETDEPPEAEKPSGSGTEKIESTIVDFDQIKADKLTSSNADEEEEDEDDEFSDVDIVKELEFWKTRVKKTIIEALESFERDIKVEKERVIEKHRPEFTKHLLSLQKYQQNGFTDLRTIITKLENSDDNDAETLSHEAIENKVKEYTEEIDNTIEELKKQTQRAELEIRTCTESIRDNTIEILDVFSNFVISELGRKLVSKSKDQMSSKGSWEDWKEYTSLKDSLTETRDKVTAHAIPLIADVVSQIQMTAQVLAEEANQHAIALKGKADHLLILRKKKRDAATLDEIEVEFYDAQEEEEENKRKKKKEEEIEKEEEEEIEKEEEEDESVYKSDSAKSTPIVKDAPAGTEPDATGAKDFEQALEDTQLADTTVAISTSFKFSPTVSNDYITETSSQNVSSVTKTSTASKDAEYDVVGKDEEYDMVEEDEEYDVIENEPDSDIVFEDEDEEEGLETLTYTKTRYVTVTTSNTGAFSSLGSSAESYSSSAEATARTMLASTGHAHGKTLSKNQVPGVGDDHKEEEKNESSTNAAGGKSTIHKTRTHQQTKIAGIEKDEL
jgi:hypothetical protein